MLKKGEKIIYGQTGVCKVLDITEKELIRNQRKKYYVLSPVFQQNNIIYAPAESGKVFMRPIITKKEADELISKIPEIEKGIEDFEITAEECREYITSHSPERLVELTAKIYKKKKHNQSLKKKLGFSDERFMQTAETLLFGELAAALNIEPQNVPEYIKSKIG